MENTCIQVCGRGYDIGTRVVLWNESGGLNGYDTSKYTHKEYDRKTGKTKLVTVEGKRYGSRTALFTPDFPKLQKIVTQFVLHHSGLYRAKDTFVVLHRQRRLSVHFILDDNGVLYQTMDLKEKAWHAGGNNPMSIGIEIDSKASVSKSPDAYDENCQVRYKVLPRRKRLDRVQRQWMVGYEYNDKQYATLIKLGIALVGLFPNMKSNGLYSVDFPRTKSGNVIKMELSQPTEHKGFICHYNITSSKIDPISFDHERFLSGVFGGNPDQPPSFVLLSTWKERQEALVELGYDPGELDGLLGPNTKKALIEFQKDNGLAADGVWGVKVDYLMDQVLKEKRVKK